MSASRAIVQKAVATGCVVVAVAGQLVFTVFVVLLGLDQLPDRATLPSAASWLVNLGWLLGFALQHSGMARQSFKRWWTRFIPPALERSVYVGLSGLLLLGLALTWQSLAGEPLWQLPAGMVILSLVAAVATVPVGLFFDQTRFFGLYQSWYGTNVADCESLQIRGPYRYVRHPLMACLLVFLWAQPVMGVSLFLLNSGLTLYIFVAIRLEETDLRRQFGQAYVDYQNRVPALVPWRPPVAAAVHSVLGEASLGDSR